jgi:hypothetical protein
MYVMYWCFSSLLLILSFIVFVISFHTFRFNVLLFEVGPPNVEIPPTLLDFSLFIEQ